MGNSGDNVKENKALKDRIEKELQPRINQLIKQNEEKTRKEKELLNKNKDLENKIKEEIQRIIVENSNMRDKIINYETLLDNLKIKQNQYEEKCAKLMEENNQLKLTCGQYQLMIQTQMNNLNQNNFNNNNILIK